MMSQFHPKIHLWREEADYEKARGVKSNASKLMEAGFVANWFTAEFQEIKWKSFLESEDEKSPGRYQVPDGSCIRKGPSIR